MAAKPKASPMSLMSQIAAKGKAKHDADAEEETKPRLSLGATSRAAPPPAAPEPKEGGGATDYTKTPPIRSTTA